MSNQVLVTGASGGIGKHIAVRLARAGFDIAVHYRRGADTARDVCEAVKAEGVNGRTVQFDVSDRTDVASTLQADMLEHGPYYGVVCNAGVHKDNAFPAMPPEDWDSVIGNNLDGFYNVLHPIVMPMVRAKNGGRIVIMSSTSGVVGNRGQVNYSAAKAGLIGAAKALAVELAKRRITVNAIAPGLIDTDMLKSSEIERVIDLIPTRRLGKPEEVAALVDFLFTPDAAYITRQVISVNGGMI